MMNMSRCCITIPHIQSFAPLLIAKNQKSTDPGHAKFQLCGSVFPTRIAFDPDPSSRGLVDLSRKATASIDSICDLFTGRMSAYPIPHIRQDLQQQRSTEERNHKGSNQTHMLSVRLPWHRYLRDISVVSLCRIRRRLKWWC